MLDVGVGEDHGAQKKKPSPKNHSRLHGFFIITYRLCGKQVRCGADQACCASCL